MSTVCYIIDANRVLNNYLIEMKNLKQNVGILVRKAIVSFVRQQNI